MKYLIECGRIDLPTVEAEIKMKKDKEYLKKHTFKIWQGKNNRWYTYLPDETKGRIQRERTTRKEIEDLIIAYYKGLEVNPTIRTVFYEWLDRKLKYGEIEKSTYTRYITDYRRCFSNISQTKIKNVTPMMIEDLLKNAVHSQGMTRKAYSNVRTIMYGMFKFAKKNGFVDFNIKEVISEIEFSKKEFVVNHRSDEEQVFSDSEEKKITEYMMENLDIVKLGLLLLFKTGLRIGELCALRQSDIVGNEIHITKTETNYKQNGKVIYEVKEHPKTDAGIRTVIVKDDAMWILRRIRNMNPFGEYVFMQGRERIRSYVFRGRLYTNCRNTGCVTKSPHKIRKTYGTKLYDSSLPKSLVCEQMGHTDVSCLEKHYYYNKLEKDQKTEAINKVVSL